MKTRTSVYILAAFALLMLVIFFASVRMEYWDAKLMPMIVSAVGFVLAAIGVGSEILRREAFVVIPEAEQIQKKPKNLLRRYLYEGGWLVGFGVAIYLIGFLAAIPLFTVSYLRLHGRRWVPAITVAAVMTGVLHTLLTYLLGVDLYPGLISELLGW